MTIDETFRHARAIAAKTLLAGIAVAAFVEQHFAAHDTDLAVCETHQIGNRHPRHAANAGDP